MKLALSRNIKIAACVYVASLVCYLSGSGGRLLHPSSDIHFAYQADMFLHHRLDLGHTPPTMNDWAEVEYIHFKDGRTIAGAYLRSQPGRFRTLEGKIETVSEGDIAN